MSRKKKRKLLRQQKRKERGGNDMSKIITLTEDMIQAATAEFNERLTKHRAMCGAVQYTKTFEDKNDKAVLYFTQLAWNKMTALLREFSKEVAWHGVASRVDGEENAYVVSDIMVYPQTVGPATVDMDEVAYSKWIVDHDGDERFQSIYFQGHSHVNMPTSPSGTDEKHQEEIISQLGPDDFYIFVIYNKALNRHIRIFDMKKNRMYDNEDVTTEMIWDFDMDGFLEESKGLVKEQYTYRGGYSGYTGGSYTGYQNNDRPVTPGGSGAKSVVTIAEARKGKSVSKPGDAGWNTDGLFGDEENPFAGEK